MNVRTLDEELFRHTEIERLQLADKLNINELNLPYALQRVPKIPKEAFFLDGNIFINKQQRFSPIPAHTHDFVEINYMYSGSCTQYINEEKINLKKNHIVVMDKDVVHRVDEIGEDDILINILVHESFLSTSILFEAAQAHSIFSEFLVNAIREKSVYHNFLLVDASENAMILQVLRGMMIEHFGWKPFREEIIKHYFSVFSYEISRELEKWALEGTRNPANPKLMEIVHHIDRHYRDISLESLAEAFQYNKNYLSLKIRQELGKGFLELLNDKRLSVARKLLRESDLSAAEIAYEIGYSDSSYFYKLFKQRYGETPLSYRKKS
ncbi:AraC family transcriptional regulator [Saccharibacillus sp. CPCC 101409]|uniref:AraC family transcriptional regulator n=1 Tax=Saccharibacillus sp. CPCC 101409 TaxID=3058041 RepID=UPI002672C313|nr:AraC family transcriptional regulator [Saccharibacillus sp. CPCC 101409]MDO3409747.1 AraC family transcriptional regulator [Saccharibacillus sp. CPCC 101409]